MYYKKILLIFDVIYNAKQDEHEGRRIQQDQEPYQVSSDDRGQRKSINCKTQLCRLVQYFCRFLAAKYAEQYEVIVSRRN